ncbi:hypothetical protein Q8791_07175 [Nocardiopsis sp. CT-R113]|uniref:Uncharacterized protein n=1 Tax=Nocardiopsis codii TaxID=3065942 RepID=A0ABU7K485_9ACTN|nr:hypothetical protein [Nocardiopsis sp. CT-R113]MEE2036999.1 hypothetical protein [Nocardiopsis sp. CT-R113]
MNPALLRLLNSADATGRVITGEHLWQTWSVAEQRQWVTPDSPEGRFVTAEGMNARRFATGEGEADHARRAVYTHAADPEDLAQLLAVLGLDHDSEEDGAVTR